MKNPLLEKWENRLNAIFDKVDMQLEEEYGDSYKVRPDRPLAGQGVYPAADGLFDLGISFSLGIGSQFGPGYVFQVRLATLEKVPPDFVEIVEDRAVFLIEKELKEIFPEKDLKVARDGNLFKVFGDLALN